MPSSVSVAQLSRARTLLCELQDRIRDTLIAARARESARFARIAAVTAADTIFHIDRISEEAVCAWFEERWPKRWPVELVMEGLPDGVATTFPRGTPVGQTQWKCILDPIDGTREIMYDKRSAWVLAGLAPQRGARTNLSDIVVAAMTELPTSKQWRSDQLSAVRGHGVVTTAFDVRTGVRERIRLRPSMARDFKQGFAALVHFFPEGKGLIGALEEELWRRLGLHGPGALVFDDQYISTGGQFYEILCGHDRMLADLRPQVFAKLGLESSLCCHPYDVSTALILEESGCIVETLDGKPLRVPLDTTSPVSWVAFANPSLAKLVRPVLRQLCREML